MSLKIRTETDPDYPDVKIVNLQGRITLEESSGALKNALKDLVAEADGHPVNILLNMAGLSYTDSSGIGEMVEGFTIVTKGGGKLKILGLQKKLDDRLRAHTLHTVFHIYNDRDAALRSFNEPDFTVTTTPAPEPYQHIDIIRPTGMLSLGSGVSEVQNAILQSRPQALIDFSGVTFIEPRAFKDLRDLRDLQDRLTYREIRLLNPWRDGDTLSRTEIASTEWRAYDDQNEALAAFASPDLRIDKRLSADDPDVTILDLHGSLKSGQGTSLLEQALRQEAREKREAISKGGLMRVVLDIRNLTYMGGEGFKVISGHASKTGRKIDLLGTETQKATLGEHFLKLDRKILTLTDEPAAVAMTNPTRDVGALHRRSGLATVEA